MNLANYSSSPSFFANFHYFYNIPYVNGLQFVKVSSAKLPIALVAKLPTALIQQTFLLAKFFTVRYVILVFYAV